MGNQATIRLTMAQALVRHLAAQFIEIDGERVRLCAGGFGIFGHGNVTCLGEALEAHREELPLWRGQNEQSMAMAAIGYAKQKLRQRFMFATSSAGPGTTNMLTSAGIAHTNRLPLLMLCGDAFATRLPDPVLQQVEHFNDPTISVNDAFKSVTRYWDRIVHPAQLIQSLPRAIDTLLDPADCGPAFLGLPQDVQGWAFDYPLAFFEEKTHRIRRQAPDELEIADAADMIKAAERPLIVAGGGVQYSRAVSELTGFAEKFGIPVVETIAGRANLVYDNPLNCGPIGVTGSNSANALASEADVVVAVGTRLQDFTTGSWSAFSKDARIISINAARHDAAKHRSMPVVGDAKLSLSALMNKMTDYATPQSWRERAAKEREDWDSYLDVNMSTVTKEGSNRPASYAQVIGAINRVCDPNDRVVAAAGGLPAEVTANWRTHAIGTVDVEFGFSCMGYEISGAWGARMGQAETEPDRETIVFIGDGSYLMLNSDIYSSVLSGMKLIIVVCDNGGFAVINKLQNNTGNTSYNNLIKDCNLAVEPFAVDFEAHARSMGANAETVESVAQLEEAFARARASDRTYVICLKTDPYEGWTDEGHAWWEVGIPEVSENPKVASARKELDENRKQQRVGL
ncbi:3D-(3,5/4)-trihydroxycyclohexane-1,2-dione acylhydrolase (decyclizing) [Hoeflea prorocentri]|uniref:3D-(3,5/4)-trihydroxycyclohexane-1,2-dione acylhydrolase (Decyclizing) n=1 Tax=Hoeflea prorocentri TaxID=1922333 RepID=A0A9X3UIX9_9HYPH|nr:3D-(3,5/4)-trihydroxycyclohexane-1,2-dione acylhydrolase (decyclizing) [Hoeflea prorocentri]MCY6381275.1 3D-(3,5/4)-trihydroxycyclohexane-1,2-dione acylhydrolase (decyclizing) [Hoeflea prorocentri]MDA5399075.1 3D-(3,5/4)-trihydroxycyclohexane-1,2-dione acylhydrolase (decyclizing) [Hoeflea prorocentri]